MGISGILEGILSSTTATTVTEIFLWILLATFIAALVCSKYCKNQKFTAYTPNLLTSIGILGTFVGIVIGLMAFDANNIDGSIALLLAGLQTAFITSLAGMFLSIVFKVLSTSPLLQTPQTQRGANGKDTGAMIVEAIERQSKQIETLHKAIAGDEETSLAGQIKLFRLESREQAEHIGKMVKTSAKLAKEQRASFDIFTEKLWLQMTEFAEMLSKSATEQVISALKDVITDFNNNLTEQFGENFIALDASVKKLVDWQENYREQLNQMNAQYAQGVQAITATETSVAHISEEARAIPATMAELHTVLETNQHQITELDRHLAAFAEVRDKAVASVPELHSQIEQITTSISTTSEAMQQAVSAGANQVATKITEATETAARTLTDSASQQAETLGKAVTDSTRELSAGVTDAMGRAANVITESAEDFDNKLTRVTSNLTEMSDTLATETIKIREQLGDAITDINNNVRNMTQNLVDGAEDMNTEILGMNKTLNKTGKQVIQDAGEIQQQVASNIDQLQRNLEASLETVMQKQTEAMNAALDGMHGAVQKAVERTGEGVNTQIKMIDEAMQKEIERVLTEMGRALASISGQFTTDYSKLTSAMSTIVRNNGVAA